jgi:flagellar biosynthesis protein FlhB
MVLGISFAGSAGMQEQKDQKTEPPSKRKLDRARKKGEVAVSRELAGAVGLVLGGAAIFFCLGGLVEDLFALAVRCFGTPAVDDWSLVLVPLEKYLAVIGGAAAAGCLLVLALQAGLRFRLRLQFSRLNPVRGLSRLFGRQRLVDLGLMIAKLFTLAAVWLFLVAPSLADLLTTPADGLEQAAGIAVALVLRAFFTLAVAILLWGLADRFLQKRRYMKRMRMTKQEVLRERKEQEGDPILRSQRKKVHRQLIDGVGFAGLGQARVVVINPTHIAVALAYREERDEAPWVVASGRGRAALRIRGEASRRGVPVVEHVPLARSLISLEPGEEIPAELYRAAAEVIRTVQEC